MEERIKHYFIQMGMKDMRENGLICPKCGAAEAHPTEDWVLIRGHKVFARGAWYSHCLVCAGYYDKNYNLNSKWKYNPRKGWFRS